METWLFPRRAKRSKRKNDFMILLFLETSTKLCSVALSNGEVLLASRQSFEDGYTHAENLHKFIDECLKEAKVSPKELDAIVVSKGPGSYTGLRIGVSAAKGLAYGLDIPIIALESLEIIAATCKASHPDFDVYIPMIDARRMEVYSASYDRSLNRLNPIQAIVVDSEEFDSYPSQRVAYFGDGAEKCQEILDTKGWKFIPGIQADAKFMISAAILKYKSAKFENTAYFEPFYLKEFIAGKPKKLL